MDPLETSLSVSNFDVSLSKQDAALGFQAFPANCAEHQPYPHGANRQEPALSLSKSFESIAHLRRAILRPGINRLLFPPGPVFCFDRESHVAKADPTSSGLSSGFEQGAAILPGSCAVGEGVPCQVTEPFQHSALSGKRVAKGSKEGLKASRLERRKAAAARAAAKAGKLMRDTENSIVLNAGEWGIGRNKRTEHRLKNRASVEKCRLKKKIRADNLENEKNQLIAENKKMKLLLSAFHDLIQSVPEMKYDYKQT